MRTSIALRFRMKHSIKDTNKITCKDIYKEETDKNTDKDISKEDKGPEYYSN